MSTFQKALNKFNWVHDIALFTLGSITADSRYGDKFDVPELIRDRTRSWLALWGNIGSKALILVPMTFYGNIDEHKWKSFTHHA